MYGEGVGVAKDEAEALKWCLLSTQNGDVDAQFRLGMMYLRGQGTGVSHNDAVHWFTAAAEQGREVGQNNLGYIYEEGMGVEKDARAATD